MGPIPNQQIAPNQQRVPSQQPNQNPRNVKNWVVNVSQRRTKRNAKEKLILWEPVNQRRKSAVAQKHRSLQRVPSQQMVPNQQLVPYQLLPNQLLPNQLVPHP